MFNICTKLFYITQSNDQVATQMRLINIFMYLSFYLEIWNMTMNILILVSEWLIHPCLVIWEFINICQNYKFTLSLTLMLTAFSRAHASYRLTFMPNSLRINQSIIDHGKVAFIVNLFTPLVKWVWPWPLRDLSVS
jgi:hypothetical protein